VRAGALLAAGDAAYGMRSYAVAAARYGEFLSTYRDLPGAARAAMAVGWAALRQGHQAQARRAWTAVADTFPGDAHAPLALVFAAELASRAGDAGATLQLLDRIITQHTASPYAGIARLTRSSLALSRQHEDEALRDLDEVVRTSGTVAIDIRRKLGEALATPGAEADLESVASRAGGGLQPVEERTLEPFARAFLERRHREAVPYTLHGLVLLAAADRGWSDVLAAALASRLVEDFPSYSPATVLLTRVATEAAAVGQWPIARRAWETMMAYTPAALGQSARVSFAEALFRTGSTAQARTIAHSLAAGGEAAPRALLLLAEIHEAWQEPHAALAVYDRVLREHPRVDRSPRSLLAHAQLLEDLGQSRRAEPVLRRLVEVSSGEVVAEAAYRLAQGLRAEGQHAAAVEWYLTSVYVAESSRWARLALLGAGASLTALDETKEALAVYRKLLPKRPGVDPPADREASGEAAFRAGEILAGADLHEDALDMFVTSARFTAGLPAERRALAGVVRCLIATGDQATAETVYRRLIAAGAAEPDLLARVRSALRASNGAAPVAHESALPEAAR
jgi:TolA-binding protein